IHPHGLDTHHNLARARLWVWDLFKLHDFWLTKRMETNRFHALTLKQLIIQAVRLHQSALVARRLHIVARARPDGQADPLGQYWFPGGEARYHLSKRRLQ